MRRIIVAGLVTLTALVSLTGCTVTMDKADVESAIKNELGKKVAVEKATCPDDLEGKVVAKMTCKIISKGNPHDVEVTVTKVEDTHVDFDMKVVS